MDRQLDPYASLAASFVEHYDTLRGRVRAVLVAEQLGAAMPARPVELLDVGGGAGHLSLHLAEHGHHVTLLDPSVEMLHRARTSLAALPPSVAARVELVEGYAHEAERLLDGRRFDVVCCHAVLPYVDDAEALLAQVTAAARPSGLISVLFKNRDALAMRAALEQRWEDAAAAFDAKADVGGLGVPTRAHTLGDVQEALGRAGAVLEAWFGIRVFSDHLDGVGADDHDAVVRVERAAAERDPYRRVARLLHVLARRSG